MGMRRERQKVRRSKPSDASSSVNATTCQVGNSPDSSQERCWSVRRRVYPHGRCRYCRVSTSHGWKRVPLRQEHNHADDETPPTQQANVTLTSSESKTTSHAWFTPAVCQGERSGLTSFKVVIGDHVGSQPNIVRSRIRTPR